VLEQRVRELRDRKHEHEVEEQLDERHPAGLVPGAAAQDVAVGTEWHAEASRRLGSLTLFRPQRRDRSAFVSSPYGGVMPIGRDQAPFGVIFGGPEVVGKTVAYAFILGSRSARGPHGSITTAHRPVTFCCIAQWNAAAHIGRELGG
jgi:hypothetical protein